LIEFYHHNRVMMIIGLKKKDYSSDQGHNPV